MQKQDRNHFSGLAQNTTPLEIINIVGGLFAAMWKGYSFGLVNPGWSLPLPKAMNLSSVFCIHSVIPLWAQRVCPNCKRSLGEIVRGYEYEKDHFVVLTAEETKSAAGKKKVIEIEDFVNIKDRHIYFQRVITLPRISLERPYALLHKAMLEEGALLLPLL